jgi:hypothetical protein
MAAPEAAEPSEPSHVVGIVRWRNPNTTLETIYRWTGIKLEGNDLAAQFLDSGLASALSFDAPLDAVVALDPKQTTEAPLMAVSVGVRSLDAARRAFQTMGPMTEVRPGEFRVSLRQGKKKSDKPACLLLSARGAAPGRLLCGRRDHDVDALRGYMARTLPERDLGGSDVHLELHAPPVVDIYAPMINQGLNIGAAMARRKLELGEPTFDRALGATTTGLSDELRALLAEFDTITLDVELAPERTTARCIGRGNNRGPPVRWPPKHRGRRPPRPCSGRSPRRPRPRATRTRPNTSASMRSASRSASCSTAF